MEKLPNHLDIRENFKDRDAVALMAVVKMVLKQDMHIVEVGSWKGFSTYYLAEAVKDCGGKVFAVDHWRMPGIFELFKYNMSVLKVDKIVESMKVDSLTASKHFENGTIDLVFLDGDHRYDNFKQDILSWFPKVKIGGIICGHDCEGYYDDYSFQAKDKININLGEDFIRYLGHPGIIKALSEFFGKQYVIMPQSTIWYYFKEQELNGKQTFGSNISIQ